MKNKLSSLKKKMMVVMKNISTLILASGAVCLVIFVPFFSTIYAKIGLAPGELIIISLVIMFMGAAGEDFFERLLYNYQK
jgi:cadmium resistance protein CadD (predicted permease)